MNLFFLGCSKKKSSITSSSSNSQPDLSKTPPEEVPVDTTSPENLKLFQLGFSLGFNMMESIAYDSSGNYYVLNLSSPFLIKYNNNNELQYKTITKGLGVDQIDATSVYDIAYKESDQTLHLLYTNNGSIHIAVIDAITGSLNHDIVTSLTDTGWLKHFALNPSSATYMYGLNNSFAHQVYILNSLGQTELTIGNGSLGVTSINLSSPGTVSFCNGKVMIPTSSGRRIRFFDLNNIGLGIQNGTILSSGHVPSKIVCDSQNNLYVHTTPNARIAFVSSNFTTIVYQNESLNYSQTSNIRLTVNNLDQLVYTYTSDIITYATSGTSLASETSLVQQLKPASEPFFMNPTLIINNRGTGTFCLAEDFFRKNIQCINNNETKFLVTDHLSTTDFIYDLSLDQFDNLYVLKQNKISKYSSLGIYVSDIVSSSTFVSGGNMAITPNNEIVVVSNTNYFAYKYSTSGILLSSFSTLSHVDDVIGNGQSIKVGFDGKIYILRGNHINIYSSDGVYLNSIDSNQTAIAHQYLDVDDSGMIWLMGGYLPTSETKKINSSGSVITSFTHTSDMTNENYIDTTAGFFINSEDRLTVFNLDKSLFIKLDTAGNLVYE